MLSYRHSFHAGNHADVLKHIVLMLILENLKLKEKGFFIWIRTLVWGVIVYPSNESEKRRNIKKVLDACGIKPTYPKMLLVM